MRIVVLGAGYAGLTCFLELQDRLHRRDQLLLINSDRYHWFTTELHTYVAGEPEEAVRVPLSRVVARPGRLAVGQVVRVDPVKQHVELSDGSQYGYDLLVFGLGSDPEYFGLPGVAEHSLVVGNWESALRLRDRIGALVGPNPRPLDAGDRPPADSLHVVVAGGGLTGVEVAGELADEYPGQFHLTILEAGPEIMAGFAPELVQAAREVLEAKGVTIATANPIVAVERGSLTLADGKRVPFSLLVWAGGVRGSGILGSSGFEIARRGRGLVDPYLRASGYENVYLVGDCAAFVDPATGQEVPPSAQAAVQMGRATGRNILRRLHGQPEEPFTPLLRGAFASLGRRAGVGQIGKEQYAGLSAMLIKHVIEAHHAWETGGGVMPLVGRLVRAPRRFLQGRPTPRVRPSSPPVTQQ